MTCELTHVLITPRTIEKSRTGDIIARLLSRTDLNLVGSMMITPDETFSNAYAQLVEKETKDSTTAKLFSDYIKLNFHPQGKKYQRVMILLLQGENACKKVNNVVGSIDNEAVSGKTIRNTFSDLVPNSDGSIRYFEPAVLTPCSLEFNDSYLSMIAEYAKGQPNIIKKELVSSVNSKDKSLVMIKPENWRSPSARPGNIIDMLSWTGLRIIGCKIHHMSVSEAFQFYGPVQAILRNKFSSQIGLKSKNILEKELNISLDNTALNALSETIGKNYADNHFNKIIEFMAGRRPEDCPPEKLNNPGSAKVMVIIYQGENAIDKIRKVLGPTNPEAAKGGTVRRDYGTSIMINAAHASDSLENAKREMKILKADYNGCHKIVTDFLQLKKKEAITNTSSIPTDS